MCTTGSAILKLIFKVQVPMEKQGHGENFQDKLMSNFLTEVVTIQQTSVYLLFFLKKYFYSGVVEPAFFSQYLGGRDRQISVI